MLCYVDSRNIIQFSPPSIHPSKYLKDSKLILLLLLLFLPLAKTTNAYIIMQLRIIVLLMMVMLKMVDENEKERESGLREAKCVVVVQIQHFD